MRRYLAFALCILFAIAVYPAEIHLKSGKVIIADDPPWIRGDVLEFHLEGQLAAVFLARVDLDRTRIGKPPKKKPKQTPTPQTLPANARVEKSKVYTNEDLEKLKSDLQMGDNSRPSVPLRNPASGDAGSGGWTSSPGPTDDTLEGFAPGAGDRSDKEKLAEIQKQLEKNKVELDEGGSKFVSRDKWGNLLIDRGAYLQEKEQLLSERQKLLDEQRKLGGGSNDPDPVLDRPLPPPQELGGQVPSDNDSYEVPTTSAGDEVTVRTY